MKRNAPNPLNMIGLVAIARATLGIVCDNNVGSTFTPQLGLN